MKKTLIALAAVAVSSAAMAQVTISGNVDARYESGKTTAAQPTKGFLFSDAQLNFAATEDLGNGLKATARFTIEGMTSDSADNHTNADGVDLSLAGGFGTVTFSSRDSSDYLGNSLVTDQLKATGVSVYNGSAQDRISYTSPTIAGVRATVTFQDGDTGTAATHTLRSKVFELDYSNGPLTANVGVLTTDTAVNAAIDGFTRFRVGYNFGVAAVSYGQISGKDAAGTADSATALAVTVPMGALTLGYTYASAKDGAAEKVDGAAYSATYALSKRTSLAAEQVNYEIMSGIANAKRTRLTLSHAF